MSGRIQMDVSTDPERLAKRATRLTPAPVSNTPPTAISFDSGHAFPGILPDLSEEASRALATHRSETLQYAPRPGLPELREWIAQYLHTDGLRGGTSDQVIVTNGAKHALELVCKLILEEGD